MLEPFQIVRTSPLLFASIPVNVPRAEIRSVMGPGLAELTSVVAAQGIAVTGPWFTHHFRTPGEIFDFEICLPVASSVSPAGRVKLARYRPEPSLKRSTTAATKASGMLGATSWSKSKRPGIKPAKTSASATSPVPKLAPTRPPGKRS